MSDLGRLLIGIGLVVALVGVVLLAGAGLGIPLGRLPGDIVVKREGFSLYFPITTSIVVSIVLSVVLYLLRR